SQRTFDVLNPHGRQDRRQAVYAIRFGGALGLVITGKLDLGAEVLIDLDGGNLLQFVEGSRLREIVHVQVVAEIRLGETRQEIGSSGVDPGLRDDVAGKNIQHAPSAGIDGRGRGIVDGILNDRAARKIGAQVAVAGYQQVVCQVTG